MIPCDFSVSRLSDTVTEITVDQEVAGYLIKRPGGTYNPLNEHGMSLLSVPEAGHRNYLLTVMRVIKSYQEAHGYI